MDLSAGLSTATPGGWPLVVAVGKIVLGRGAGGIQEFDRVLLVLSHGVPRHHRRCSCACPRIAGWGTPRPPLLITAVSSGGGAQQTGGSSCWSRRYRISPAATALIWSVSRPPWGRVPIGRHALEPFFGLWRRPGARSRRQTGSGCNGCRPERMHSLPCSWGHPALRRCPNIVFLAPWSWL